MYYNAYKKSDFISFCLKQRSYMVLHVLSESVFSKHGVFDGTLNALWLKITESVSRLYATYTPIYLHTYIQL